MKKRYRLNWKRFMTTLFYIILLLSALWFCASWIEIICKNTSVNPEYSDLNLLKLLVDMFIER